MRSSYKQGGLKFPIRIELDVVEDSLGVLNTLSRSSGQSYRTDSRSIS